MDCCFSRRENENFFVHIMMRSMCSLLLLFEDGGHNIRYETDKMIVTRWERLRCCEIFSKHPLPRPRYFSFLPYSLFHSRDCISPRGRKYRTITFSCVIEVEQKENRELREVPFLYTQTHHHTDTDHDTWRKPRGMKKKHELNKGKSLGSTEGCRTLAYASCNVLRR